MFQLTDAVKHLLLINVIMFIGTMLIMGDPPISIANNLINEVNTNGVEWERLSLAVFYPTSPYFEPYQIVTHLFMHADIGHLFFNMFALFMFGPHLERLWGPKRFTFFYFVAGFGALVLHFLVKYLEINYFGAPFYLKNIPTLGASGAIFGVLAGFAMKFPDVKLFLIFLPIPIKAKYFVLIYAAFELLMGLNPYAQSGVAHFAHLGGALFGFLLILYWNRYGSNLN